MKKIILLFSIVVLLILAGLYAKKKYYDPQIKLIQARKQVNDLVEKNDIRDGDIIFQISNSKQSKAIQLATHSKYSHCGIIFKDSSGFIVYEAVQPVKQTPLDKWIARGQDGIYVIKRLKNADQVLTADMIIKMRSICSGFAGKDYDIYFNWSDDKIYCSELIWKVYKQATGMEIGKLQKLKEFDLTNDEVKQQLKERYGNNIPLEEPVISPENIFECDLLETVKSN